MNTINQSGVFTRWLAGLRDQIARKRVAARIFAAGTGNFGDHHFLRDGVWEMRIHYGPGYRVYYAREGATVYLLLAGGDKGTQDGDIEKSVMLWQSVRKGD